MFIDRFNNEERLTFTSGRTRNSEGRGRMKAKGFVAAIVAVAALVVPAIASAHTSGLVLHGVCNTQTGNYDLTWTVTPTDQSKAPKIFASNRASIPVGATVPAAFTESIAGTSTFVSATVTVRWNDNVKSSPSAGMEFDGNCKPPVIPPVTPSPPTSRQGFCDPATGEFLDLAVGQDKQPPYASRGLVPAVAGACPPKAVPPVVVPPSVVPPKPVPPKAKPPVKKPKPKAKPKHKPKPKPKPDPFKGSLPFTG